MTRGTAPDGNVSRLGLKPFSSLHRVAGADKGLDNPRHCVCRRPVTCQGFHCRRGNGCRGFGFGMDPSYPCWCKPRLLCHQAPASSRLYGRESCRPRKSGHSGRLAQTGFGPRGLQGSLDGALHLGCPCLLHWANWLSKPSPSQTEPPALLSQPSRGWLIPCAGCLPSQTAGACMPAHVSPRPLPSDGV